MNCTCEVYCAVAAAELLSSIGIPRTARPPQPSHPTNILISTITFPHYLHSVAAGLPSPSSRNETPRDPFTNISRVRLFKVNISSAIWVVRLLWLLPPGREPAKNTWAKVFGRHSARPDLWRWLGCAADSALHCAELHRSIN